MLEQLKQQVYQANMDLVKHALVIFTWGNVSSVDRDAGLIVIKPSGIDYTDLSPEKMTVIDFDQNIIEGEYKPSSDTATHIELYKHFPDIKGVVHTHSSYATSFAQTCLPIPAYGTTHADYFYGDIPCTRILTEQEVIQQYEKNTGKVIVETFESKDHKAIPGVLVANHGAFAWGSSAADAVHNSVVMEEIAKMAYRTITLNQAMLNNPAQNSKTEHSNIKPQSTHILPSLTGDIPHYILDKHYFRKHGAGAYYGNS